MASEEYLKGYIEGFKEALATVGQDLQDHEIAEYSVEDYGKLYQNVAKQMGNCVLCPKADIGTEKGCPVGKTIWCPRITETLEDGFRDKNTLEDSFRDKETLEDIPKKE